MAFVALSSIALAGTDFEENGHYVYHDMAKWNFTSASVMIDSFENQTITLVFDDGTKKDIPLEDVNPRAATSIEIDTNNSTIDVLMSVPINCCDSKFIPLFSKSNASWVEVTGANITARLYASYGKPFDTQMETLGIRGKGTVRFSVYNNGEAILMDGLAEKGILENTATVDLTPYHYIL